MSEERQARDEAIFMSDIQLWADVRKFIRWSANVRDDMPEAIAVAKALNERIDAADNEASDRLRAALAAPAQGTVPLGVYEAAVGELNRLRTAQEEGLDECEWRRAVRCRFDRDRCIVHMSNRVSPSPRSHTIP